jgi:class 3 adenylate cyclase
VRARPPERRGGALIGGLGVVAKRLTLRVLGEAREKASIHRLFGEYVSEEVREKLMHDPPPAGGELAEVAVLFSDVRGFTTFSETMAPAELVTRLNTYFDAMVAPIRAEGGVVDKFIGDAIMAVFGGVLKLDDPAGAAVRAAFGMRERLAALNASWERDGIARIDAGVGVHFGAAVLGSIGSAERKDFTVMGDTVNTASRVEGLTKSAGHGILVTRAVYDRLAPELQARLAPLGNFSAKGKAVELELFGARD